MKCKKCKVIFVGSQQRCEVEEGGKLRKCTSLLRESLHVNKVNHLKIKNKPIERLCQPNRGRNKQQNKQPAQPVRKSFSFRIQFWVWKLLIHFTNTEYAFFGPSRAVRKKFKSVTRYLRIFGIQLKSAEKKNLTA